MVQIFRVDAAAVVAHFDLNHGRQYIPLYLNRISALCVVKGILYKIVHSFLHPVTVAPKCNRL